MRGQIWENIAAALNSLQQPKFRVTASQELFEIGIHVKLQNENKRCATKRKPPQSNYRWSYKRTLAVFMLETLKSS